MMPYNPYAYTVPIQQGYAQPIIQQPQPTVAVQAPQQPEQLINGGLIVVPNEEEVKRYPVAPGNVVTFRIENQPIVIEKSVGRSQFAVPQYEKWRLTKEDDVTTETVSATDVEIIDKPSDDIFGELADIRKNLEHIDLQIDILKDNYVDMKKSIKTNNNVRKQEKDGEDV